MSPEDAAGFACLNFRCTQPASNSSGPRENAEAVTQERGRQTRRLRPPNGIGAASMLHAATVGRFNPLTHSNSSSRPEVLLLSCVTGVFIYKSAPADLL